MTRRALVTVRLPGARIAPTRRICAHSQTRLENSGRKARMTNASSAGKVGIKHYIDHLFYLPPRCMSLRLSTITVGVGYEPCRRFDVNHGHRKWTKSSSAFV